MIRKILYIQGVTIMGGAPHSLIQLAGDLDRDRFEPQAVLGGPGTLRDSLEQKGVKTHLVKMGMWRKGKSFPFIPITLRKISGIIRKEGIDLVHNNTVWDNPYGLFPAKWNKIPAVCHLRSPIKPEMVRKYFLNRPDRLICISQAIKKSVYTGLYRKTSIIYNGVDTDTFHPEIDRTPVREEFGVKPGEVLIGQISRLDPLKGQETAIRALAGLSGKTVKLILVGALNETAKQLKKLAKDLQVENRVFLTGYRKDIPEITAALDIALLPSLHEGFGRVIIEAMACGKPVIATQVGGIPEIISEGKTGFIIPPENPQKLTESLEELIDNPELRSRMGTNGYKRVIEHFSAAHNIEATQQVYDKLLR